jgi:outer membrane lipoprotein-sorting protein
MENSFKPSLKLKVLIGLAVCLTLVSLYFFIAALTQSSDSPTNASSKQNNTKAIEDNKALQAQIADYEDKLTQIQNELRLKDTEINELQAFKRQSEELPVCEEPKVDTDTQLAYQACSSDLSEKESELLLAQQSVETLRDELSVAQENAQALAQANSEQDDSQDIETQEALALLNEENAALLTRISLLETELETSSEIVLDTAAIDLLQTQLADAEQEIANAEQENIRLLTLVNELQIGDEAIDEEPDESTIASNVLKHSRFEATPTYCDTQFQEGQVCLSELEIGLTFNFNPNGFISLRLIDPNGDTVDRQSVAGRTVNSVTFEFDTDEASLKGEYTLEIKIDDVFNNYRATERFDI